MSGQGLRLCEGGRRCVRVPKRKRPPDPAPETPRGGVPENVPSPAGEDCLEERLAVLLAAALLLLCRFLYLSRYVVYSGNEAYLDFDRTLSATRDPKQTQNPDDFPFTTLIASQSPDEPQTQQRSKIQGYYITTNMLSDGVDAVRAALDAANDYDAVMIDVKSVFGNYYYRSKLSGAQIATSADIDAVEALIRELTARTDLTVIARVPAFSEPNYAFAHQNQALALYSGALWMDEKRCYWLDPSDASVQSFLASIALELQDLGFDEVLFDQFYFPSSDAINWSSDLGLTRQTAVQNAAEGIRAALEGSSIRVDFVSDDPAVAAQADRIAVANEDAAAVESTAAAFADVLTDPSSQLLFLTSSRDTRYENYSVLRPLLDEQ